MKPTDMTSALTADRVRELLNYNPETGVFSWRDPTRTAKIVHLLIQRRYASSASNPYHLMIIDDRNFLAHRIAWLYFYGVWPAKYLDHINGNRSDNRIANLREADKRQNSGNRHFLNANNKSGFRGVSYRPDSKKWRAVIRIDDKLKSLGSFATKEEAKAAYDAAHIQHFGDFANTSI